ncbi:hypothetical protein ACVWXO_002930 [Bradyrhizobium sp. LM2.7]
MRSAASPAHSASSSAHCLEHARQPLDRRLRHHRAAMGARFDEAARHQLAQRLAHRRTRDVEAPCNVGFVKRRAGSKGAAHDLVGELKTQLLGTRDLLHRWRGTVDAWHHRLGRYYAPREIVKRHTIRSLSARR